MIWYYLVHDNLFVSGLDWGTIINHPEIQVVDNYQDDGRTGTDSDREDFQRLLADIYAKKINCVIVKDLSRLSRNDYESFMQL